VPRSSKIALTAEDLRGSELYGLLVRARGEAGDYPATEIERKLFAAEDFFERDLGIRLRVTRVLSAPEERGSSLDPVLAINPPFDPTVDLAEPGYDYEPDLWSAQRWALIKLRHGPVRQIDRVVFRWPGGTRIWQVPADYISMDRKGSINIKPGNNPAMLSFNAYMLSIFAGGIGLPHSIVIDYQIGFTPQELDANEQDLVEAIRLRAVLLLGGVITQIASGGGLQSESIGTDGLSHSRGLGSGKWGVYSGVIEQAAAQEQAFRDAWKRKNRGVPAVFA